MFCAQSDPWTKDEEEVSCMFMMFEFMFPIIFVMVFGMIIFQFATGIGTWHKNNQSPRLSVNATIVAKRESITHHSHANAGDLSGTHGYHSTSSTSYYVTFQVESGDRMELPVSGREYGMLAEGDIGKLTFQERDICHLSACDSGGDSVKEICQSSRSLTTFRADRLRSSS